jgi:hypothetical protein
VESRAFAEIVELARALALAASHHQQARLQALAACCYGLTARDFEHVLGTFPLVQAWERSAAMDEFLRMRSRENS